MSANTLILIGSSYDTATFVLGDTIGEYVELIPKVTTEERYALVKNLTSTHIGFKVYDTVLKIRFFWTSASWSEYNNSTSAKLVVNTATSQSSIDISHSLTPTMGQVLTASSATEAAWSDPYFDPLYSQVHFSGILSGTNAIANMIVGSGATLTYTGTGTINASTLEGHSFSEFAYFPVSAAGWLHDDGLGSRTWTTPTYSDVGALAVNGVAADSSKLNGNLATYYQTAYTNLDAIGGLVNAPGWLYNDGAGFFSYATPTLTSFSGTLLPSHGGTGVANSNLSTLTLAGDFATTFTRTAPTNVTFPTSGTLMVNPMTTVGDIIYGDISGTSTRLPGSLINGVYVLSATTTASTSGIPEWVLSTGTGDNVLANSPSINTPVFTGGATFSTGTSSVSSGATLSISSGASLTVASGATFTSLTTPSNSSDVVTKGYVDSLVDAPKISISDVDYTATGINNQILAYTTLSITRTVTLPPATTSGQTIKIFDESGNASEASQIIITPNGSDVIEANRYNSLVFPFASTAVQSNGTGKWNVIYTNNVHIGAGILTSPVYTDLGTGSITVGNGIYNLFSNADGIGRIKAYTVTGGSFTPVDGNLSYLVCNYNSDSPIIQLITDVTLINETTIIPVITFFRKGITIHIIKWDNLGKALTNKLHQSIVKTQRFRRQSGFTLGETPVRNITISSGILWYGAASVTMPSFSSSIDSFYLYYHTAPNVWTETPITQYNNSQYDDNTGGLKSLNGASKYAVNFVYEIVSNSSKSVYIVLGQGNYLLGDAQLCQPPSDLPIEITAMAILIGRIIIANGNSTATQIDSAFAIQFSPSAINDHNQLTDLQGGITNEYYHLTNADHVIATQPASSTLNGYMTSTYAAKLDGIATDAQVNVLEGVTGTAPIVAGAITAKSQAISISPATTSLPGSMSASDKTKLDALYIQAPPSVTKDSTGFSNPTAVTQSYDSITRMVTLSGTFTAYWQGNLVPELVGGWVSPAHDTTPGPHFLYYDGATFAWYPAPWAFDMLQIAYVYYGASDKFGIRECHGLMPWQVHEELHRTIGTYYEIGGDLGGYTLASTVAANRRPSVSATTVHDEDITSVITALADNGPYTQMWMSGSTNTFLTGAADIVPLLGAQPYWNSAGTQVLMTNNSYMAIWLVAAPVMSSAGSQLYRYIWVQGQSEGTLGAQQTLAFNTLSLGTLATVFTEFAPIGRVVIRYTAGNWSIAQVDKISGTRVASTLVSGGGLTSVTANPPLSGSGTVADPLTIPAATALVNGYATSTQIAKLDGITVGAQVNVLEGVTGTAPIVAGAVTAKSQAISINAATTLLPGSMSAADKAKLDGVATGATANLGTVTSVTAGAGMTQSGVSTVNPILDVVSHAGTAGSVGTVVVTADSVGVSLGATSTTACSGNDARLSDARTPTVHDQSLTTITTAIATGTLLKSNGTNPVASTVTEAMVTANNAKVSFPGFGATGITACVGNDARLSDARTPTAHVLNSASHTVSGLTTGHFLKASSATTFGFAAHGLTYTDVGALASGGTAVDSSKLGGQLPAYYQAALGYTPINKAGDTGIGALSMGALTATTGTFSSTTASTSTTTGAVTIAGGLGVAGAANIGGAVSMGALTATSGTFSSTISASNLSGTNTGDNPGVTSVSTAGSVSGLTLTGGPITGVGTITLGGSITGFQPVDADLTAIAALAGTTGLLKKTAVDTWALDTTAYGTGSVASVAALTIGTTGTDLSSSVANGTTTPVITLNVPTASAANRGALSAADWTAFNSKQAALGYTPINKAGDTGIGALSMGALTAMSGYFSAGLSVTGSITASVSVVVGANCGIGTADNSTFYINPFGPSSFNGQSVSMGMLTATTGIFSSTTASTSTTTGAVTITGGLGVAGAVNIGGALAATSANFTTATWIVGGNLNSYTRTGVYVGYNLTNAPTASVEWWTVEVQGNGNDIVLQKATLAQYSDGIGSTYKRTSINNGATWGAWISESSTVAAVSMGALTATTGAFSDILFSNGLIKSSGAGSPNLHLDSTAGAQAVYLNFYGGSGGTNFGNGANGIVASISGTGALTATSGTFSGSITAEAGGETFRSVAATTSAKALRLANTGCDVYFGVEDSVGAYFGATAYNSVIYSPSNNLKIHTPNATFTSSVYMGALTTTSNTTTNSIGTDGQSAWDINANGMGINTRIKFANTQIGGQTLGLGYLQWLRDTSQGRTFSVFTCNAIGTSVEAFKLDGPNGGTATFSSSVSMGALTATTGVFSGRVFSSAGALATNYNLGPSNAGTNPVVSGNAYIGWNRTDGDGEIDLVSSGGTGNASLKVYKQNNITGALTETFSVLSDGLHTSGGTFSSAVSMGALTATTGTFSSTTASTSTTTGAVTIAGGLGVAGAVNIGGVLTATGRADLAVGNERLTITRVASPQWGMNLFMGVDQGTNDGAFGLQTQYNSAQPTFSLVRSTSSMAYGGDPATLTYTPMLTFTQTGAATFASSVSMGALTATTGIFSSTISASNLSGTNTGDQTNISGNANTVSSLSGHNISELTNNSGYISSIGLNRTTLSAPATIDSLTASNFRTVLFGSSANGYNISSARWDTTPTPLSGLSMYGTMLAWGASDTHGFLALNYNGAGAKIGGGNADAINWTADLITSANIGSQTVANATNAVANNGSTWTPHTNSYRNASWNTFYTDYGYIQIGPANAGTAHLYTDRPSFYFNKDILVLGSTVIHSGTIGSQTVATAGNLTGHAAGYAYADGGTSSACSGNAATATTLQTARTINGVSFDGSANITVADSTKIPSAGGPLTGDIVVGTADRDTGIFGTYDYTKTQHIWSMGIAYRNAADGTSFGNLYGLAYKYSGSAGGHGTYHVINGTATCGMGTNLWTSGACIAATGAFSSSVSMGALTATTGALSSSFSVGGDINFNYVQNAIRTVWGGAFGGALQVMADAATVTRWARIGIVSGANVWQGGMAINNDLSATFSSSVSMGALTAATGTFSSTISASNLSGTNTGDQTNISGSSSFATNTTTLDLSGLDPATWYPVTFVLDNTRRTRCRIKVGLNSGTVPSWSTHANGFTVLCDWTSNGGGWGTAPIQRTIHSYTYKYSNISPVGGIDQMSNSSTEVVYLRGGGRYYFESDSPVTPVIQTATYTVNSQSVSPTTALINDVFITATSNTSVGTLAVNGPLTATSGTFSGSITAEAGGETFRSVAATTSAKALRLANTGCDVYFGVEDSVGAYFGATAYNSVIYSPSNNLKIHTPNATFTSSVYMGALTATTGTFSGSVTATDLFLSGATSSGRVTSDGGGNILFGYNMGSPMGIYIYSGTTNTASISGTGALTATTGTFSSTTASTSTTTGAVTIAGGLGVAGAANIGGAVSMGALTATSITVTGGGTLISRSIVSAATNTSAGSTIGVDYVYFMSGTTTLTLPTAVGNSNQYIVKNTGSATVTMATTASQTIEGSTTAALSPNTSLTVISDNSNWRIV